MEVQLKWESTNENNEEFYLKCHNAVCANLIADDCDSCIGNTLVLWNSGAEDIGDGCENEYESSFEDVKHKIEFDTTHFFKQCFGDSCKVEIDESAFEEFRNEWGMYTDYDEMKPDIDEDEEWDEDEDESDE